MAKSITGRITLNLVAGILVTVVTVAGAIFWMAERQNDQADEATTTMVVGGLQAMERRVQGISNDYSWWEDAYDAYVRGDADWMWSNVGSSIEDTQIADLMAIISPQDNVDYVWTTSEASVPAAEIVTPEIIAGIHQLTADMPVDNLAARAAYITAGDDIYLIAVSRIAPVSRADEVDAATLPYFVAGFLLSPERLSNLGESFLIGDLRFVPAGETDPHASFPEIKGINGQSIGNLAWTPPTPGHAVLRSVLLPIVIALTLFCLVALVTALRARRMAIALSDSEKEALTAARTDSMTGLMNRTGFTELVESDEHQLACRGGRLAVIYVDINGFKIVNDSIGHHGGDELVRALANRISRVLPPDAVLARIGGDEFAVALCGEKVQERVLDLARGIGHSIDRPFTISGFEFHVTASVGYALSGDPGIDAAEIIRRADLAMYQAKNAAEREPVAYHNSMETGALEKKRIERGLRRAIEQGELKVYYQPVLRASDLTVVGLEALMRWTSPEFGPVSPVVFIPVAEETGLIHDVGRFVVSRACQDLHRWPTLTMAINLSPVQLRDPGFADELRSIVEGHGHNPERFDLELTEGILVNNPTIAQRKLTMLKKFGFRLSLDDFGTGFSSIGYLRQFPFDTLKIDRSFVRDIGAKANAGSLLQSLISLGEALELSVVAEGIENEEQLSLLRLMRCGFVQGFMFAKPVPAEEVDQAIAAIAAMRIGAPGAGDRPARLIAATA
jgi:diguanylate cyclase (GGDEF)-like protein